MDGGGREGGNLDGKAGNDGRREQQRGRHDCTVQSDSLPSVRKAQPAGGNGDFGLTFWLHRMVGRTDWLLEAGTLAIFETSAYCGALYNRGCITCGSN